MPLADKQRLMALTDGPARLAAVAEFLRQHGVA